MKFILSGAADEVFTKHGLVTARQAAEEAAKEPAPKEPTKKRARRK